jgi:hypothetical protein
MPFPPTRITWYLQQKTYLETDSKSVGDYHMYHQIKTVGTCLVRCMCQRLAMTQNPCRPRRSQFAPNQSLGSAPPFAVYLIQRVQNRSCRRPPPTAKPLKRISTAAHIQCLCYYGKFIPEDLYSIIQLIILEVLHTLFKKALARSGRQGSSDLR